VQGPSSFPTSAAPSLHHRSKCAHHHLSTMQCLPSVHCHRTSTITHLSPLCFPGQKVHIRLLVGSRCPKYNHGFPLPQRQQHTYRIVLAARSSNGICSSRVIRFPLHLTSKSTSSLSLPVFCSRRPWYIGIGLYSLPRSLDGVRAVPHPPFSYHSIDHLRHAALPSLSLPLATVLTDSVIYICCERTGCSVDLLYRFFFVRFGRNLRSLYRNEILSSH
jgi:hypothetical protein